MFTRCPQCNTVFRISASQLRVAGGDVRCGSCAHVFNALGNLSDDLPDGASAGGRPPGSVPSGVRHDIAQAGSEDVDDAALEFDAPERTWSQYFIDATRKPAAGDAPDAGTKGDVALDGELETITADPDEWRAFLDEMGDRAGAQWDDDMAPDALGREQQVYVVEQDTCGAVTGADPADDNAPHSETEPGEVPDEIRLDEHPAPAGLPADDDLDEPVPAWRDESDAPPARRGIWLAASLALLAALLAQVVHLNRDRLAADEIFGPQLRSIYARIGLPLFPDWPLDAYRVRRAEALAGGTAPDSLDITAAVETSGRGSLGLPLIRVALRDQWANTVASRVFRPPQYLPEPMPEIVPAGTRIPVRLAVVDPGSEARGFVVDLCLPRRSGLDCQLNRDPFAP